MLGCFVCRAGRTLDHRSKKGSELQPAESNDDDDGDDERATETGTGPIGPVAAVAA